MILKDNSALSQVSPINFRQAMRELTGAVCVITVGKGDSKTGFVATSVSSFSAEPPVLILCIDKSSSSWNSLRETARFGVNFMRDEDWAVADRFAGFGGIKGKDRYEGTKWMELPSGTQVLENALATIDCSVEETIDRHDHIIVLGRVEHIRQCANSKPLLWFRSKYHILGNELEKPET
ncbi:flavin reductase family protein [Pedobacter miscanthi]|uniref:Flavin reductase n=1 Tax=Pedobacter miscanthi TaxID=2259170 RepID=A0A366L1S1_9SPHI|nr:flavin reductase family protein [Pedobacter miscanthi]RBQ07851.1 flavin reductase [Pedobacter miscanthi]